MMELFLSENLKPFININNINQQCIIKNMDYSFNLNNQELNIKHLEINNKIFIDDYLSINSKYFINKSVSNTLLKLIKPNIVIFINNDNINNLINEIFQKITVLPNGDYCFTIYSELLIVIINIKILTKVNCWILNIFQKETIEVKTRFIKYCLLC
jgi:hypothetical protein